MSFINQPHWRWTLFGIPVLTAHATLFSSLSQPPEMIPPVEETGISIEINITEFIQTTEEAAPEEEPPPSHQKSNIKDIIAEQAAAEETAKQKASQEKEQKRKRLAEIESLEKAEIAAKEQRRLHQEKAMKEAKAKKIAEQKVLAQKLAQKKITEQIAKKKKLAAEKSRQATLAKKIVTQPKATKRVNPRYPKSLQRKGLEGTVKLNLQVNSNGAISSIAISQSSGHTAFDQAALKAVKKWSFTPAKNGLGQQVACSKKENIIFRLQ